MPEVSLGFVESSKYGEILIGVEHKAEHVFIHIDRARGLILVDELHIPDPYVFLL